MGSKVKEADLLRLECNDMRMIRWMCNVTLKDRKPSSELKDCLDLIALGTALEEAD